MIREHEFNLPDSNGRQWCMHCGARFRLEMGETCIERPGTAAALCPEPARRVWACNDFGAIRERCAELDAEHDAIRAAQQEQETT
jgi:hypothetical protein